jgi:hypothetical protein
MLIAAARAFYMSNLGVVPGCIRADNGGTVFGAFPDWPFRTERRHNLQEQRLFDYDGCCIP